MPDFRLKNDGKRIAVDASHVAAVVEEGETCVLILGCGLSYDLTTNFETTTKALRGGDAK